MIQKETTPDFAIEWTKRLGVSPRTLVSLKGGINAQVFRCGARNRYFVLKGYPNYINNSQQRFMAELAFLKYTENVAPKFTPRVFYSDLESHSIVLEYIDGEEFNAKKIPKEKEILDAVQFFQILNEKKNIKKTSLLAAAESFLKISDHLDNIDIRLGQMSIDHIPENLKSLARKAFLSMYIKAEKLREEILYFISSGILENAISLENRYISPGDFGFHNAIMTKSGLKFIDFEFSGFDDPSKTILDFDLQPRVSVLPKSLILLKAIPENDRARVNCRCNVLEPILKLKWGCILLNILNPQRWQKIKIYHPEQVSIALIRKRIQLSIDYSI